MKMPIFPDAVVNAVMGYGVVFVGLLLLMAVVILMGKAMTAKKTDKVAVTPGQDGPVAAVTASREGPVAPGSAGKVALHDVADREAAMLMAIVADKLGKPVNELRFKSIKEVK